MSWHMSLLNKSVHSLRIQEIVSKADRSWKARSPIQSKPSIVTRSENTSPCELWRMLQCFSQFLKHQKACFFGGWKCQKVMRKKEMIWKLLNLTLEARKDLLVWTRQSLANPLVCCLSKHCMNNRTLGEQGLSCGTPSLDYLRDTSLGPPTGILDSTFPPFHCSCRNRWTPWCLHLIFCRQWLD